MHRSIDQLKQRPDFIAVDGNKFKPYQDIPHHCQVKGDATYMNIAAASVLAKTYRDDRMKDLATEYPEYGWERNAGYPTKQHRDAIREFGATPHHRKSFQLLPAQLNLFGD
jgi:ribonuclease HII